MAAESNAKGVISFMADDENVLCLVFEIFQFATKEIAYSTTLRNYNFASIVKLGGQYVLKADFDGVGRYSYLHNIHNSFEYMFDCDFSLSISDEEKELLKNHDWSMQYQYTDWEESSRMLSKVTVLSSHFKGDAYNNGYCNILNNKPFAYTVSNFMSVIDMPFYQACDEVFSTITGDYAPIEKTFGDLLVIAKRLGYKNEDAMLSDFSTYPYETYEGLMVAMDHYG